MGTSINRINTHIDIVYLEGVLSQFTKAPCQVHWQGGISVLAYIKYAPRKGLIYKKHGSLPNKAYSNGGMLRIKVIELTAGFCPYVHCSLVIWHSEKQKVVVYSTAVAKYSTWSEIHI